MRVLLRLVLLASAFAAAQWAFGWWAPAAVGAAWGVVGARTGRPVLVAATAAALGGAAWLAVAAASGRLGALLEVLAETVRLPGPVLVALSLTIVAGLSAAGCAAALGLRRLG